MDAPARRPTALLLSTALVVACTAALLVAPPRGGTLAERLATGDGAGPLEAYVVLQVADCDSNLLFLQLFLRPSLRDGMTLTGLVVGGEESVRAARRRLAPFGLDFPLRPLPRPALQALNALGYTHTPLLFVLDAGGRLRLASPPPSDAREAAGLLTALESLTVDEETP